MVEIALIRDLAFIWIASLIVGHICVRIKQPMMAGYMLAGIVIGPHGLRLISQTEQITVIAEFGVAMLLFALGVDLSLKQVVSSARRILLAGISQMVLTIGLAWWLANFFGLTKSLVTSFLFGCVCAISSSVIISKVLTERGESESIHGRILVPLSLVQDFGLVLIIPFLPILQQTNGSNLTDFIFSAGKAGVFVTLIFIGATKIVPHLVSLSAKANSRELFLLTLIGLCLTVALLSQSLGLSIALGAFLAGIMISESPYIHQALTDVMPLRDLFSTVFFASIGMLLNPVFIFQNWLLVILFVLFLVIGKALIGSVCSLFATSNIRSAILVGIGLAQIGEFSFVLLSLGYKSKLITTAMYNLFFAGAVVTLITCPILMSLVPVLFKRWHLFSDRKSQTESEIEEVTDLKNHVVMCGYGRIGRNVGMVFEAHKIPFVVVELNAGIVDDLNSQRIPHVYGDAVSPLVLKKTNIKQAACLIITTPDPVSTITITNFAKMNNPQLKIIARAHRTEDINAFLEVGVNSVVQPEFEASIEITRLALQSMEKSIPEIQVALDRIRSQRYKLFRLPISEIQ